MTNILIRVDAGFGCGLGHLQRCLSLASALHARGVSCIFLTVGELEVQNRIATLGFVACALGDIELGSEHDCKQTLKIAALHQCIGIVVDSYEADARFLSNLREAGLFVTVIDDLARLFLPCHLVINGGVQAESLSYRSLTGDTQFLLGPRYALLRQEFWDVRPPAVKDEVQNVLVTMGGADGRNLMPAILEILDSSPGDFSVTPIVGPFFSNRAEVEAVAKRCRRRVSLVHSPDSVRDLMVEADLAISAAGQTLSELAATGTPTIGIQIAENQAGNLQFMAQYGVIRPIRFEHRKQLEADLPHMLNDLLTKPERRMNMSLAGPKLVDGKGAFRCAETLVTSLAQI